MSDSPSKSDSRTRTFSLRLTDAEHKRIREIARRLGSSDSAVIRYAIRTMLKKTGPLSEPRSSAYSLIPVFVECEELISYFDLDADRLDAIINGETADAERKVDADDLALLYASGLGTQHVHAKLRDLQSEGVSPGDAPSMLRGYFYKKYIYEVATAED